eukprot:3044251-Rhodomonas_salina.1
MQTSTRSDHRVAMSQQPWTGQTEATRNSLQPTTSYRREGPPLISLKLSFAHSASFPCSCEDRQGESLVAPLPTFPVQISPRP